MAGLDEILDLLEIYDLLAGLVVRLERVQQEADVVAEVEYLRLVPVDLSVALVRLRSDHAVRAILCEGGPYLNASLVADGLIDELFLTTFPVIAGGAGALTIMDDAVLGAPVQLSLLWLLEHDGELFARYAVGESAA